jgi:hypothetical protein
MVAAEHGQGALILDLLCASPLVCPRDLFALRGVAKHYRDVVDSKLMGHVSIVKVFDNYGKAGACILSADDKRLPGFTPVAYGDRLATKTYTRHMTQMEEGMNRLGHTTVVDIVNATAQYLKKFLPHVHTIRLLSDMDGFHTYCAPTIGGPHATMIVFPSFMPCLDERLTAIKVPNNVSTLVQHLTDTFDRGGILFRSPGTNVETEIWFFTHYELKVHPGRFGLVDDRVLDFTDASYERLVNLTAARLKATSIDLTFVDNDDGFKNLGLAFHLWEVNDDGGDTQRAEVEAHIKDVLGYKGIDRWGKLHFKTWTEYAASLTTEQEALQTLPRDVRIDLHPDGPG